MVQLTARPLPIPEDPDSNPVIGKFYLVSTVLKSFLDKTKIKKKEAKKDKLTSCQFFDHAPSMCTLQSLWLLAVCKMTSGNNNNSNDNSNDDSDSYSTIKRNSIK